MGIQISRRAAGAMPRQLSHSSSFATANHATRDGVGRTGSNIRTAGGRDRIRVATDIFTQPAELDSFLDAVQRALRA